MKASELQKFFSLVVKCYRKGQYQIRELIQHGELPSTLKDFSQVHNYIDGNELADSDEIYGTYEVTEATNCLNIVQMMLNIWIKSGILNTQTDKKWYGS